MDLWWTLDLLDYYDDRTRRCQRPPSWNISTIDETNDRLETRPASLCWRTANTCPQNLQQLLSRGLTTGTCLFSWNEWVEKMRVSPSSKVECLVQPLAEVTHFRVGYVSTNMQYPDALKGRFVKTYHNLARLLIVCGYSKQLAIAAAHKHDSNKKEQIPK